MGYDLSSGNNNEYHGAKSKPWVKHEVWFSSRYTLHHWLPSGVEGIGKQNR